MSAEKKENTLARVAEGAGVSRSSVSRAFTRPYLLRRDTVERIKAVADQLGYVPNRSARALSTGRNGNIALMVPDVANPYYTTMTSSVQQQADLSNYCVFLGSSFAKPEKEDELLHRFFGQVEGMILVGSCLQEKGIHKYATRCPLVLVNRELKGTPRVLIDSGTGMREAVQHLAAFGHREIAYIGGFLKSWSNKQRKTAVSESAEALGMRVNHFSVGQPSFDAGKKAASNLISTNTTAAIAFNDLVALGLIAGLSERGKSVPEDMSVIGCDDALGMFNHLPLTTVHCGCAEAGRLAVTILLEMLERNTVFDARSVLETHLVVRSTTSGCR